jgi:hypothetical protein
MTLRNCPFVNDKLKRLRKELISSLQPTIPNTLAMRVGVLVQQP